MMISRAARRRIVTGPWVIVALVFLAPLVFGAAVITNYFLENRTIDPPAKAVQEVAAGNQIVFRGSVENGTGRPTVREALLFIKPLPNEDFTTFTGRETERLSAIGWKFDIVEPDNVDGANFDLDALLSYEPISAFATLTVTDVLSDETARKLPGLKRQCRSCVIARVSRIVKSDGD